ncbi:hypothetical protein [Rubrivirga sp.]|uniref:hypothetical protein n=1 Tax=Rubrivirga sp. TaxID=1885344 RepID=UPI003C734C65
MPSPQTPPAGLEGSRTVVGYDPGGNGRHGLALLDLEDGQPHALRLSTHPTVESVLTALEDESVAAVGVDTLTCWATGRSGWRPADRWLRREYPASRRSTAAPNSLYGSMSVGGMAVLLALRARQPEVPVSETHPKVLYRALWHRHYDYVAEAKPMDADLSARLGLEVGTANDHEWDAAVSALVALHLLRGDWPRDLHTLPTDADERLVWPCGPTHFVWPE